MQQYPKPPLHEIAVKRIADFPAKPTLVFLHDSLGCIELWRDFPQKLGQLTQCNVLIYDRQGYGKSCPFAYTQRDKDYMEEEADILNELLSYWGLEQVILFGHSDGGSIALIAAAKYPDKIMGIITEGAHIFVEDISVEGIQEAIYLYQTTDLNTRLEKYHGEKTPDMFWAWAATWTNEDFYSWNIEHFLPLIHCSALVIQGENDEYGTLHQVTQAVRQISGQAQALIIPNVKHTPHKEVPELILEKSTRFIEQLLGENNAK